MPSIKILIVENELLIAEDLSMKLNEAGYEVTGIVTTGSAAIEAVKQQEPDVLIMDIILDGKMDGIEAVVQIKKNRSIPVIYLTDVNSEDIVDRASATCPAAYLTKPFNERQIGASIRQALYNNSEGLQADAGDIKTQGQDPVLLNDMLLIRQSNNHYKKISPSDISFLEANGQYSYIHLVNGDKFTYSVSMNHIHEKIGLPTLVRVSRSHVVNLEKVTEVKGNLLVLGKVEIMIGETFKETVIKRLPFLR